MEFPEHFSRITEEHIVAAKSFQLIVSEPTNENVICVCCVDHIIPTKCRFNRSNLQRSIDRVQDDASVIPKGKDLCLIGRLIH